MQTTDKMNQCWRDWHTGVDPDVMPNPNSSFKRGYRDGYAEALLGVAQQIGKMCDEMKGENKNDAQ